MTAHTDEESTGEPLDHRQDTHAEVATLRAVLDGRWAPLRGEVRDYLATVAVGDTEQDVATQRGRTWEALHALAGTGVPRIGFPAEFGGKDDVGGALTAFEMLGLGDLSVMVKAGVQWGLFGGAVQLLGTSAHHREYLEKIISLELPGCFAMTETGHGSDVANLATTATFDADTAEFVLDTPVEAARKDYIGNAARDGRMAVVFAQLYTQGRSYGVHAFLVPIRDENGRALPGVRIEDCGAKAGLNGVDNGRLSFHAVRVARTALLNRFGDVTADGNYHSDIESDNRRFFTMIGTLIRGRVSVAGAAGNATKTALTIALRYAETRRQFARPGERQEVLLLDYLAHQRKLLPALAKTYALHFTQQELVAALHDSAETETETETVTETVTDDAERSRRELESRAAGIKAVTTWHATATIALCREACGGAGYLAENRLPALKADTDVFTTFEGDNTVLLQLVAKGLLTNFQVHFEELDTVGMTKFIAESVLDTVLERTAARPLIERLISAVSGTEESLTDRGWQLRAFRDRERHVLGGLARRLRRATEPDTDSFAIFNQAQDHVLRAGRVHVERILLEAFVSAVQDCADPASAALLDQVCELFALSSIESDLAWFLGHDRISAARARTVARLVNERCAALRPQAGLLVDALGVPESCVAAAIATGAEHKRQQEQAEHE